MKIFDKRNSNYLVKLIFESNLNEIALEAHISSTFHNSHGFFPFKVLQFSSVFTRPNFFYHSTIRILLLLIIAVQFSIAILFYILFFFRLFIPQKPANNIIVSSKIYKDLVNDSLDQLRLNQESFSYVNFFFLLSYVNKERLIKYLCFLLKYTRYAIIYSKDLFLSLLYYKDILKSYLLCVYIIDNPKLIVLTEDHYQRSAFMISNLSTRMFIIVQHGFIDNRIQFPIKFGSIDHLILRDISFLEAFKTFYRVKNYSILTRDSSLLFSKRNLSASCFLASSAPFIDSEIEFAVLFKKLYKYKLIVKVHPRHIYNSEKLSVLLNLADEHWIDKSYLPNSILFVSHSSFLEFDYLAAGSFTFRLADYSNDLESLFEKSSFRNAITAIEESECLS